MFVHGSGGHADWWRFIAPFFSSDHRVAAISLSGMGESDWRERYDFQIYSSEVLAGAREGGLFSNAAGPIIVAHSLGTLPALLAAASRADDIAGLVLVDAPLAYRPAPPPERGEPRPPSSFTSIEEARGRFRTLPATHCAPTYLMDFLADASLSVDHGAHGQSPAVRWKGDPNRKQALSYQPVGPAMANVRCPLWMMRGENSEVITEEAKAWLSPRLPSHTRWMDVPMCGHQIMLDQPLAFVAALRAIVASMTPPNVGRAD
ncbi:MAG TPA: alpha/beta hydrolase [Caulobacteraceae bacterium]|jgi:pimeloyl-ACP methyl ester carboxylesterase|nr:alpha/beta hydrolase [Caulobacteraceae bacterium]